MLNIFKKKDPIDMFWQWFAANKSVLEELGSHVPMEVALEKLNIVGAELRKVSDGLLVEVSKAGNGLLDLTITSEGDKTKFPIIEEVAAKAPEIPGWKITAFRQRMGTGFGLRTDSIELNVKKMFFQQAGDETDLDLIVYAENIAGLDEDMVGHFGIVLMDNLLGEYDSVMKVRYYDFRDLTEADGLDRLIPLAELPEFVDDFYSKSNN